jgi:hypothetical protein
MRLGDDGEILIFEWKAKKLHFFFGPLDKDDLTILLYKICLT